MSPIIVGGRTLFGSLSSQPTGITTAVGSEYYDTTDGEKRVYASTGWQNVSTASAAPAISTIADLTSQASWTVWPNGGNYSGAYNDSNYYGSRGEVAHGNGTIRHNSYEYGIYTKFNCRDDHTKTGVYQLYDFNSNQSNFDGFYGGTDPGNLWGMGVAWNQTATNMYQTNSIYARSELTSGNGAYFVTGGTGNRTWSFHDGGANSNANGQSSTNREAQKSVNWQWGANIAERRLTYIVYGSGSANHAGKVRLFRGENLVHEFTSSPGSSHSNVWMFSLYMYPNSQQGKWDNIDMKARYATFSAATSINI